jgi:prophage antirepressor-like protein
MPNTKLPNQGQTADIVPFSFQEKPVRTVRMDGDLWFILKDVAKVLGMRQHKNFLESEWCEKGGVYSVDLIDSLGRSQKATAISEANVYAMVLRSDKPEAIAFHRWVTHEVLPTIRKTGIYMAPEIEDSAAFAGVMDLARQLSLFEHRLNQIERVQKEANADALALPEPLCTLPGTSHADCVRKAVQTLSKLTGARMDALWPRIYREVENRYHVRLSVKARNARWKGSVLSYAIQHTYGDWVYAVVHDMVQSALKDSMGVA